MPLVPLFCVLGTQFLQRLIQLISRFAGLTWLLMSPPPGSQPSCYYLPPTTRFHLAPHTLKTACNTHPRQPLPVTYRSLTLSHMLLEVDPYLAHPTLGTCLAVLSTYLWAKRRQVCQEGEGSRGKASQMLKIYRKLHSAAPSRCFPFHF